MQIQVRLDPADESKIIDLRELGALVDPRRPAPRPAAADSAVALPTFGAAQLQGPGARAVAPARAVAARPAPAAYPSQAPPMVAPAPAPVAHATQAQPVLMPLPARVPTATPSAPDRTVLMLLIGALTIAVVGLGAFVVFDEPTTVVIERAKPVLEGIAVAALGDEEEDEPEAASAAATPEDEEGASAEAEEAEAEEEADPDALDDEELAAELYADAGKRRNPRGHGRRPGKRDKSKPPASSGMPWDDPPTKPTKTKEPKTTKPAAPSKSDDIPVECVIDPASCGMGKSDKKNPPPAKDPKPKPDDTNLPNKLDATAIKRGMGPVKSKAKGCRARHGGAPGEKVQVKLTVQGNSGRVVKAAAMGDHAGTPLGACVAQALSGAKLDRFQASVQGIIYGVRM